MTETEDEVTPLFRPGLALIEKARFICNINGELSMWDVGEPPTLRIYGADSYGIWLIGEEGVKDHIARATKYTSNKTIIAIDRNYETIILYMRMLRGAQP